MTTSSVVLATHEAAGNVIRHAHQGLPNAQLQIQCWLQPDLVEIHILDEGEPFDLESIPDLDPAELRIGGRGVFLMRALITGVRAQLDLIPPILALFLAAAAYEGLMLALLRRAIRRGSGKINLGDVL